MHIGYLAHVIRPAALIHNPAMETRGGCWAPAASTRTTSATPRPGATEEPGRDMDSIDEVLGELPLPPYVTAEDVGFAIKALTVHAAEQWPDGPRCRNDRAPHPCRLHRWGRRVLDQRGLTDRQIQTLIAEQEAPHR